MPIDFKKDILKELLKTLEQLLEQLPSAAIAFSGGVDSTFLVAVTKNIIKGPLLAVNAASRFVPLTETDQAKAVAARLGVEYVEFQAGMFSNKEVIQNTPQRCYFCKKQIFSSIKQIAREKGIHHLLHGVNLDDLGDFRPGLKAAQELGFLSPLADAGLAKSQIRELSRQMGLATWNKPSQSCLATRIPYHDIITVQKLAMIDTAEQVLHDLGFEQVRVRCMGKSAQVEVEPQFVSRITAPEIRQKVSVALKKIGFDRISIDMDGYKTGKMNHEISICEIE
ncbi:MAG: ATP-dependent sacrificial sulfur transferase LarE [Proteobacteria bacterium]|nr:ATP-dependent sacrificial sulfur transferase LarE [Pseudomonadota bacterium]MBU1387076.1 ATP-dependent sacrificial sulfur transferase LarE [Pseudomonadota bacterium]MBU1541607.1 ATP-dependent sacrificial sulfur transferase LarE [Pseudomonadota bacterium]MBU2429125.1 ATP-dependent sacrificial sulfur transferase LarE [Pseudomonadota bacterium]MBU2479509.1 ATP-dependent sacrificial sulfur transferase LarE [Pseudomonadota bacterium]